MAQRKRVGLITQRSEDRNLESLSEKKNCGGLAQSEECVVSNDEAPGSKPGFSNIRYKTRKKFFFCQRSIVVLLHLFRKQRVTSSILVVGFYSSFKIFFFFFFHETRPKKIFFHAFMAEWSKAIDSSSILFGGVSSNLTECKNTAKKFFFFFFCREDTMAEWLRR